MVEEFTPDVPLTGKPVIGSELVGAPNRVRVNPHARARDL